MWLHYCWNLLSGCPIVVKSPHSPALKFPHSLCSLPCTPFSSYFFQRNSSLLCVLYLYSPCRFCLNCFSPLHSSTSSCLFAVRCSFKTLGLNSTFPSIPSLSDNGSVLIMCPSPYAPYLFDAPKSVLALCFLSFETLAAVLHVMVLFFRSGSHRCCASLTDAQRVLSLRTIQYSFSVF